MIRKALMSGTAIAVLAFAAPGAFAQSPDQGVHGGSPSAGKPEHRRSAAGDERTGGKSEQHRQSRHKAGKADGAREHSAATEGRQDDKAKAQRRAEERAGAKHERKAASEEKAKPAPGEASKRQAREAHGGANKERKAESGEQRAGKGATTRTGETDKSASPGERRDGASRQAGSERRKGGEARHVNFTTEQRTRFRETVRKQNVRNESVNVRISIGTRLPRHVRLYALPPTFISFAPDYRRYRYTLVDDRYVIVDPDSYEIVYVVDEGGGVHRVGGEVAVLDLTAGERRAILRHIDRRRRVSLNIDLALGAEIPGRIELMEFPTAFLGEVPKLRGYRYVVLDRRVAIVNPKDRDVLAIIKD